MATSKRLRVLIAIDGSSVAEATIETVVKFPWPDATQVSGVVALRSGEYRLRSKPFAEALESSLTDAAVSARRALSTRWDKAEVVTVNKTPVDAILDEARDSRADIIALGWRGHGSFRRLLAGSVSRAVAARAAGSILVVRSAPQAVRRFVVGFDDSPHAHRAVSLLSRLEPRPRGRAVLVNVIHVVKPPSGRRIPAAARASLRRDIDAFNLKRFEQAQRALADAVGQLQRAGWSAEAEVRKGSPLTGVLSAAREHSADVLVLGARATSGLTRVLLGSVAQGALNSSPIPVLLVR